MAYVSYLAGGFVLGLLYLELRSNDLVVAVCLNYWWLDYRFCDCCLFCGFSAFVGCRLIVCCDLVVCVADVAFVLFCLPICARLVSRVVAGCLISAVYGQLLPAVF